LRLHGGTKAREIRRGDLVFDILLALKDEDSYRADAGIEPASVASVGSCFIGAASTTP
jgi:hypothetical protein